MILVEAPNQDLYKHWAAQQPYISRYQRITSTASLRGYTGEIIVLNGGSQDPQVRSMVMRLASAGHFSITHVEV